MQFKKIIGAVSGAILGGLTGGLLSYPGAIGSFFHNAKKFTSTIKDAREGFDLFMGFLLFGLPPLVLIILPAAIIISPIRGIIKGMILGGIIGSQIEKEGVTLMSSVTEVGKEMFTYRDGCKTFQYKDFYDYQAPVSMKPDHKKDQKSSLTSTFASVTSTLNAGKNKLMNLFSRPKNSSNESSPAAAWPTFNEQRSLRTSSVVEKNHGWPKFNWQEPSATEESSESPRVGRTSRLSSF